MVPYFNPKKEQINEMYKLGSQLGSQLDSKKTTNKTYILQKTYTKTAFKQTIHPHKSTIQVN